ncbi:DUF1573 domain-containing protein [Candidatus Azambacteria bacterium]|nr:DUF1573 domain-containing protein [Candidatus Azambacteria bacterium]
MILALGIGALLLGIGISIAKPKNETPGFQARLLASAGTLSAEHPAFDFGAVSMAAGNVAHTFQVKNTGEAPVTIGKMYTSCMCTTARLEHGGVRKGPFGMPGHGFAGEREANETIGPGEEAAVEVIFDPAAHGPAGIGRIERIVYLEPEAGKPLELTIAATVTP